jgi:hypothetical protein
LTDGNDINGAGTNCQGFVKTRHERANPRWAAGLRKCYRFKKNLIIVPMFAWPKA